MRIGTMYGLLGILSNIGGSRMTVIQTKKTK